MARMLCPHAVFIKGNMDEYSKAAPGFAVAYALKNFYYRPLKIAKMLLKINVI